jgi:glutathione S-transferase
MTVVGGFTAGQCSRAPQRRRSARRPPRLALPREPRHLSAKMPGSGFVAANSNSKIPARLDCSGPKPVRMFEAGPILAYPAKKLGAFLPTDGTRAECLSWLFWQMG